MSRLGWAIIALLLTGVPPWAAAEELVRAATAGAEITVSTSGHILSFSQPGGRNLLWRHPAAAAHPVGGWVNHGGDKLWLWPQQRWEELSGAAWPPPAQAEGWLITVTAGRVRMESPRLTLPDVRFVREIELDPHEPACRITSRMSRADGGSGALALWMVTQLPTPLAIHAPAGTQAHAVSGRTPWSQAALPDGGLRLTPGPGKSKLGLDASGLTAVYADGSLEMRAESAPDGVWGPGERAQVYSEGDGSADLPPGCPGYAEAEFTAPLADRGPLPELTVTWRWNRR